ncbi:hypothetical protein HRbin41_00857 [bacterium HR41]|nr:hypothetical protein HRbin41_00857 [bacterium HR41]
MHAVKATVGNRPGVDRRQLPCPLARADRVGDAVPDDPRAQLGELFRRVAPVEHVKHLAQQLARELGERPGATHERVQLGYRHLFFTGGDGDDLLAEHVERIAGYTDLFDRAVAHPLAHHCCFQKVGTELREHAPFRDLTDAVTGPPNALKAGGDGLGRLDLHHQIDSAHVDAELERRGRNDARNLAGFEQLFDAVALFARKRTVVGASHHDRLSCPLGREFIEPHRQPLGAAAVVDEDDRRAMAFDEFEQRWVDRGPDRSLRAGTVGGGGELRAAVGLGHVVDGHADLEVETGFLARVEHAAAASGADEEAADLLQRRGRR